MAGVSGLPFAVLRAYAGSDLPKVNPLIKGSTLKIYPGAPHGLTDTHKDQLNADLLAFLKA